LNKQIFFLYGICVMVDYCRHHSQVPLWHTLLKLSRSGALSGEGRAFHISSHRSAERQVRAGCILLWLLIPIKLLSNKLQ